MKETLKDIAQGCAPIAVALFLAARLCLMLALCGCKAQKVVERVEVPVVVTQEHTVESVKIDHVRDTLIQRDSIFHYVKGDTVLIEKWHYLQGSTNVVKVDTLHVTDSVPYPVEVEKVTVKTEEVERDLTWWQKTKMGMGTVLLVLLVVALGFGGMRLYGKIKKL
jgi:hypothetical protein